MNIKNTWQKSRNDSIKENEFNQNTEEPGTLYEIKKLSKNLLELTKIDFEKLSNLIFKIILFLKK